MTAPGPPDEIPDIYTRYLRTVYDLGRYPNEVAGRWKHMAGPAEREFWRSADAVTSECDSLRDMLDEATRTMLNLGTRPAEVNLAHRLRKQAGLAP